MTGRPNEVTDEQIIQAGLALESAGTRVTGTALRKIIGAGMPSRLLRVWNAHKEGNPASTTEVAVLPVELEDALKPITDQLNASLRQLVGNLHQTSTRIAERRVTEITHAAEQEREAFETDLDQASEMLDNAEQANAKLREELAQLREAYTQKSSELAQVSERLEHAQDNVRSARLQATEAQEKAQTAQERADELERQLSQVQHEHAQELGRHQAALASAQEQHRDTVKLLEQSRITCDAVTERLNLKSTELASAQSQISEIRERMVDQGVRLEEQRSALHDKRQQVIRLERQQDDMSAELRVLREQVAKLPLEPQA